MKIIEYFLANDQNYWLSKIKESDWVAGQFLYELLLGNNFKSLVGENSKVLLLVDGKELISFCTLTERDDIITTLTPWIGFVYTFPEYRGKRYIEKLLNYAEELALSEGFKNVYISTNHDGLYEKYGYSFLKIMKDIYDEDSKVYVKQL